MPVAVILIGTMGGLIAHGLIGLFVGPIVFALGFRLFQVWVRPPSVGHSAVERDLGHGQIGVEGAADRDQTEPAQGCGVEGRLDPMRGEAGEGQLDRRRRRRCRELGPVGLPGPLARGGAQMTAVALAIAAHQQRTPAKADRSTGPPPGARSSPSG